MSDNLYIRDAVPEDAAGLLAVYAPYVLYTAVTFEYEVPSTEEFTRRIRLVTAAYPYLICEKDGQAAGYAYAGPFKERAAYGWSAETSIYISRSLRGRGIGTLLYRRLEDCLRAQNICNLCACITYPNPDSIAFHERFGYHKAAHFSRSGYKNNQWHDMIWMEKSLNRHSIPPKPFIPYPQTARRSP